MQRHGAKRLATQTPIGIVITRRRFSGNSLSYYSPSSHPPLRFLHDNGDHELFCRLLGACKRSSDLRTATETHARIIIFGYESHPSLAASLMSAYVHCALPNFGFKVFDQVLSSSSNLTVANLLIERLMRNREYQIARKLFDKMRARDAVTWNTVIGGYLRNARYEEAMGIFRAMLRSNVEPDKFTFASVMAACAKLGAFGQAEWVHELLVEKGIEMNYILNSALIDMYAKCGRIQISKEVFDSVQRDNVSIWNSMINGLAIHGLAFDAMTVFSRMTADETLPDPITFLAILLACSHCGLVEQGRWYFGLMKNYSVQPQIEHYGVMVDLLGRAGHLEEAYALIEGMSIEPDIVIWRALLSACRTHKNASLGEIAIANMSRLKSGDYVLLSNMYCSERKWDSAQAVREMMSKDKVRKVQGKSWIEWMGVFHQFKAGDRSHPESEAIYKVLEGLIHLTKLKGFVPSTDLVMMDISEEEKEGNLIHHSEKLALAFGILKSTPGTQIMVSKNLRICYDCHTWIKMVSSLLDRVILVRDRIRFHRFEGGSCSCGDYW